MPEAQDEHPGEQESPQTGNRLNRLRAGVLGANDGIISTAGLVIGVAGATTDRRAIVIAGLAGLVSGSLSMAGGEYVSVSSQRDTEQAMIVQEEHELRTMPEAEERELAGFYVERGLSPELANQVAAELMQKDPLRAHAEVELGIDVDDYSNPWHAALVSCAAFATGACLPLGAIISTPSTIRIPASGIAVVLALILTGYVSATIGEARRFKAIIRNVSVGLVTMVVTYGIGTLFDIATN